MFKIIKFMLFVAFFSTFGYLIYGSLVSFGIGNITAIFIASFLTAFSALTFYPTPRLTIYTMELKRETPKRKNKPLTPEQRKRKNANARANYAKKKEQEARFEKTRKDSQARKEKKEIYKHYY